MILCIYPPYYYLEEGKMTLCTHCGVEVVAPTDWLIDPNTVEAGFCSTACIVEHSDALPDNTAPRVFPKA